MLLDNACQLRNSLIHTRTRRKIKHLVPIYLNCSFDINFVAIVGVELL